MKDRTSGWLKGDKPRLTKDYCHPLKPNNLKLLYDDYVMEAFELSVRAFRKLAEQDLVCMPECLLFLTERDHFKKALKIEEEKEEELKCLMAKKFREMEELENAGSDEDCDADEEFAE